MTPDTATANKTIPYITSSPSSFWCEAFSSQNATQTTPKQGIQATNSHYPLDKSKHDAHLQAHNTLDPDHRLPYLNCLIPCKIAILRNFILRSVRKSVECVFCVDSIPSSFTFLSRYYKKKGRAQIHVEIYLNWPLELQSEGTVWRCSNTFTV
jgi:hypothetical protein